MSRLTWPDDSSREALQALLARLAELDADLDALRARLDAEIDALDTRLESVRDQPTHDDTEAPPGHGAGDALDPGEL